MLLAISIALAIFVLPSPWGLVAVIVGALLEIGETGIFLWWSQRRRASVGVESLVGRTGVAVGALQPEGQVKIAGELWKARCAAGCDPGSRVVVREVEGLVLVVDPAPTDA